jgi:hypothetical protein
MVRQVLSEINSFIALTYLILYRHRHETFGAASGRAF